MPNLTLPQSVALAAASGVLAFAVLGFPPIRIAEIMGICIIGAVAAPFVIAKARIVRIGMKAVAYRRAHGRWPWEN